MKTFFSMLFLVIFVISASAQEETLISGPIESGGYGAPVAKFGQIKGQTGIFVGGQGGWIINHAFVIGGGGYSLVNDIKATTDDLGRVLYLDFSYGGLLMEYIIASRKLVHFSIHSLIGVGHVNYRLKDYDDSDYYGSDRFFVLEPGANLMLNLHKNIRIGVGATYRYVSDVDYGELSNSDLRGVTAQLILKFGSF